MFNQKTKSTLKVQSLHPLTASPVSMKYADILVSKSWSPFPKRIRVSKGETIVSRLLQTLPSELAGKALDRELGAPAAPDRAPSSWMGLGGKICKPLD